MALADILPAGFSPLAIDLDRGLPQTASAQVDGRAIEITLVGAPADLPALLSTPETALVVEVGAAERARPSSVPASVRDRFRRTPPTTLSAGAVGLYLLVWEDRTLLASRPVEVGVPMKVALAGEGLVLELFVGACRVHSGTFVRPGAVGSSIRAGFRGRLKGVERFERAAAGPEGDVHADLA